MSIQAHPLYDTWRGMIERCRNPGHVRWHRYGGRGVSVCDRWKRSFWNFVEDMGEKPAGTTLDRKDNDKGYSPDNCRWSTSRTQRRNGLRVTWVTHRGQTLCITDWAAHLGVNRTTLRSRAEARGWDFPAAIDSFL